MDYMSEYKRWLDCSALSADEHAELAAVADNQEEIESRFFAPLSFGTAGLRGVLGVGLNRMNRFTVGQAAQGLAKLIVSNGQEAMDRGVAIAYDSRHFSPGDPQKILNDSLLPAINKVGEYFDKGKYFLPQLIASAEAMKLSIEYLEPLLSKGQQKGEMPVVVIATVAGDIHDIGKNLVALMMKNYGFQVIDLGKDCSVCMVFYSIYIIEWCILHSK